MTTSASLIRRWLRVHGPELSPGRFRFYGWPAERASERYLVVDLWQIVGGQRWSIAFTRTRKLATEQEPTR